MTSLLSAKGPSVTLSLPCFSATRAAPSPVGSKPPVSISEPSAVRFSMSLFISSISRCGGAAVVSGPEMTRNM
jgi:hypothetical protein